MKYRVTKTFEIEANSQSHADMLVSEDVALKYPERGVLKQKGWRDKTEDEMKENESLKYLQVRDESKDEYEEVRIKVIENK